MLTDDQIIKIDAVLKSVGEPTTTDQEVGFLNIAGFEVNSEPCDYYKGSLLVVEDRHKHDKCFIPSKDKLIFLAQQAGCNLEPKSNKADLIMPLMAFGYKG